MLMIEVLSTIWKRMGFPFCVLLFLISFLFNSHNKSIFYIIKKDRGNEIRTSHPGLGSFYKRKGQLVQCEGHYFSLNMMITFSKITKNERKQSKCVIIRGCFFLSTRNLLVRVHFFYKRSLPQGLAPKVPYSMAFFTTF